jgi:hypothetical protein
MRDSVARGNDVVTRGPHTQASFEPAELAGILPIDEREVAQGRGVRAGAESACAVGIVRGAWVVKCAGCLLLGYLQDNLLSE